MEQDVENVERTIVVSEQSLEHAEDDIARQPEVFRRDLQKVKRIRFNGVDPAENHVIVGDKSVIDRGNISEDCRRNDSEIPLPHGGNYSGFSFHQQVKIAIVSATHSDIRRYKVNYFKEQDGIALYRALAKAEKNTDRAEIFEKLAAAEEHHAARWAKLLEDNGVQVPLYKPSFRVRLLGWLSRSLGTQHVLPVISGFESRDQGEYIGQAEATGFPAAERSHSRTLQLMLQENAAAGAQSIVKSERWHSQGYGGSLRAAVFGVNDGLISNFGLVMGVAGSNAEPKFVLLAGVAGLLAGAFSMAAGEYVSVRSQRELYEQQLALEAQELETSPEEEQEELALIYQAKGIRADQANELARQILSNPETAIDTLAREELGLDPDSLGSPWAAAFSSFVAFGIGAVIPVIPYLLMHSATAIFVSAIVCGVALFLVGALISIFTGRNMAYSGFRMVGIGALAAGITFAVGRLLGVSVAG